MAALDPTFGCYEEELPDAAEAEDLDDGAPQSIALQRLRFDLRATMHAREQSGSAARPGAEYLRARRALIEWICDTTDRLSLHRSTFHTASNFVDRSLSQGALARGGQYALVAVACLRIAAKHCETETAVPPLSALTAECGERHSEWELAQMEITVLTALDWRVHCDTSYDFLGALGLSPLIRTGDQIGGMGVGHAGNQYSGEVELLIRRYAEFFVDLAVYEYPHGSTPESLQAAAAVAAARMLFSVTPTWPDSLQRDSGYAQYALNVTICHLLDIFMHDFSDDWARLQEMAHGLMPALAKGDSSDSRQKLQSPTSVADLLLSQQNQMR
ncbi:cyclin-like protein [Pavlovales sp. CCMP2436]|nr:cyclin-like protein [Pavlovales sp. CCMP2436]|mmetsp:Transcript_21609/g.54824  ORF Transcript_21609/g.54824 Transcript_21609/m.54824 type:complete len:329 (-) Transcript_21609:168-1154(-)